MNYVGGVGGQFDYVSAGGFNPSETMGRTAELEESEFVNSRAEAKKAHFERMSQLRFNDVERSALAQEEEKNRSEPKQSAFQIAVSVANGSESKVTIAICMYIRFLFFIIFSCYCCRK